MFIAPTKSLLGLAVPARGRPKTASGLMNTDFSPRALSQPRFSAKAKTIFYKTKGRLKADLLFFTLLLLEALAAVYRAILTRLKRNLTRISAACANCIIHLALGSTLASLCLTLVAASFATKGLVLKTLLGIKFLLSGSKSEFLSAIFADQCFVVIHVIPLFSCGSLPAYFS